MGRPQRKKDKKKPKRTHTKGPKPDKVECENELPEEPSEVTKKENSSSKYGIDQLLDKAQECIDTFNYELAQKFCQRALELDPDNLRVLETSGTLLLELGDSEGAKKCFGRAVELSPDKGHAKYMYLGQLFEGAEAVQCFQKGIELMTNELQQQQQREVSAAFSGSGDEMVSSKDISTAYCSIAEIYMTDCCFEEAAEEKCRTNIEKAISSDDTNAEAYQLMASFFLSKEDREEARKMIEKSVSLWLPKMKGMENETLLQDPAEVAPINYSARINASQILIETESYDLASEILEGLLDEDEDVIQVWYLLGWLNYLQGEDYKGNARYYLDKADKLSKKVSCSDKPMLSHIQELLQELGPGEDEDEEEEGAEMDDFESDSDAEDAVESMES
ncbi:probable assembly chaperone of rpl4 [Lingula anatina]|uniref:Probable assembly chaperone of rpl4 n=1 Tax=Lingula anatina TaxID=7574 RepID=A0A1S3IZP2_LINAN|nr:probable assembly chaperone of rpl4 [Lingula anatina]|eukprot:XP_013403019.1 probable assembly chaperone of rpl4 [Lingula anatina]